MNVEREQEAIERLKAFAPKSGEPYYLAYSGGKDSDCIRILAALADVPHEIHHNLTTVDAPETINYIKSIPNVIIDKARYDDGTPKTMWNLIPKKKMPPTRLVRWCCSELKEAGGKGRFLITGVRWSESQNRRENQGGITVIGKAKDTQRFLTENNINFRLTNRGGGAELRQRNFERQRRHDVALFQNAKNNAESYRGLDRPRCMGVLASLRMSRKPVVSMRGNTNRLHRMPSCGGETAEG